jgi:MFS family permease
MKDVDIFFVQWTFLGFFALFELGSALCGAAASSSMLIIGRAVAGLGGSGLLNGGYTIIHSIVPMEKQPCIEPQPSGKKVCS